MVKQIKRQKLLLNQHYKLQEVVEELTGHKVIRFKYENNGSDILVENHIDNTIEKLLNNRSSKIKRFDSTTSRINEVNQKVVDAICLGLQQAPVFNATKLKINGYSDIELEFNYIEDNGIVKDKTKYYYIEIIVTTQNTIELFKQRQDLRMVYLSNLNNIQHDGSHILLLIQYDKTKNNDKLFTWNYWSVYDLIDLPLNLKIEYNASLKQILELPTL